MNLHRHRNISYKLKKKTRKQNIRDRTHEKEIIYQYGFTSMMGTGSVKENKKNEIDYIHFIYHSLKKSVIK